MLKIVLLGIFIVFNWFQSILSMKESPVATIFLTVDNNTDRNFVLNRKGLELIKIPAKASAIKATIPLILKEAKPYFIAKESFILTDTTLNKHFEPIITAKAVYEDQNKVKNTLSVFILLSWEDKLRVLTPPYITSHVPSEIEYKVHLTLDGDNLEKSIIDIVMGSIK